LALSFHNRLPFYTVDRDWKKSIFDATRFKSATNQKTIFGTHPALFKNVVVFSFSSLSPFRQKHDPPLLPFFMMASIVKRWFP